MKYWCLAFGNFLSIIRDTSCAISGHKSVDCLAVFFANVISQIFDYVYHVSVSFDFCWFHARSQCFREIAQHIKDTRSIAAISVIYRKLYQFLFKQELSWICSHTCVRRCRYHLPVQIHWAWEHSWCNYPLFWQLLIFACSLCHCR